MTISSESNNIAKANGDWGERTALDILTAKFDDLQYTNDLIDYYARSNIPIEIKTCQEFIKRLDDKGEYRHGRFTLTKDQHDLLTHQNGYYLFLVKAGSLLARYCLVEANDITYKNQITWRSIFIDNQGVF